MLGTWTGRGLAGAASETARVAKSPDLVGRSGEFRAASKASEPAVPECGVPGTRALRRHRGGLQRAQVLLRELGVLGDVFHVVEPLIIVVGLLREGDQVVIW